MSLLTDTIALQTYLSDNWTETPIDFINHGFVLPDNKPWIRFAAISGVTTQVSMGDKQDHRSLYLITTSIFVPIGDGSGRALEFADTLSSLFTSKQIGEVTTRSTSINTIGETASGNWFQVNTVTPAYSDSEIQFEIT